MELGAISNKTPNIYCKAACVKPRAGLKSVRGPMQDCSLRQITIDISCNPTAHLECAKSSRDNTQSSPSFLDILHRTPSLRHSRCLYLSHWKPMRLSNVLPQSAGLVLIIWLFRFFWYFLFVLLKDGITFLTLAEHATSRTLCSVFVQRRGKSHGL
jgi:hypothetical protein